MFPLKITLEVVGGGPSNEIAPPFFVAELLVKLESVILREQSESIVSHLKTIAPPSFALFPINYVLTI